MSKTVIQELKELTRNCSIQSLYWKLKGTCPCCEHKAIIGREPKIVCPKCEEGYDVIDTLKFMNNNVDNLGLLRLLREDKVKIASISKEEVERLNEKNKAEALLKEEERKRIVNMTFRNCVELTDNAIKYLKDRCIYSAINMLDKNFIEVKSNVYGGRETIVYRFRKQNAGIQKRLERGADGKRFVTNLNRPSTISHRCNNSNTFVVVEGIEDGLSALVLNKNFICLNSVSKFNKFADAIIKNKDFYRKFHFELCLDTDEAGDECLKKMKELLDKQELSYSISSYYMDMKKLNMKDLNDLLQYKYSNNKVREDKVCR